MIFLVIKVLWMAALLFGMYVAFRRREMGALWAFLLFFAGSLIESLFPFLVQQMLQNGDLQYLKLVPYWGSVPYVLYLTATLFLVRSLLQKGGR